MPISTTMTVYDWMVPQYAYAVYLSGNRRFTARDGISGIPTDYVIPCKQYAATHYSETQIQTALANGWINQQEYDETMAYRIV